MYNDHHDHHEHPSPGAKIVQTKVHTETHDTEDDQGVQEQIVTRVITDFYDDGTHTVRRETYSTREEDVGGRGSRGSGGVSGSRHSGGHRINGAEEVYSHSASWNHVNQITPSYGGHGHGSSEHHYNNVANLPNTVQEVYGEPVIMSTPEQVFVDEALKRHNKLRHTHNSPPLSVSPELCREAQTWANELVRKGNMENSNFGYGENIYWSSSPGKNMKGDVPVEYWYHEQRNFDWSRMDFQKPTGSFTQMIWKDSKQFGIAKASGKKGTFVVAFYLPPGNVLGKFRENVQKASGHH